MMLFFVFTFIAHTELIVTNADQGDGHLILSEGAHPCKGYPKIYYKNEWGYIGDKKWTDVTEEVVCRSVHCGQPLKSTENPDVYRDMSATVWLNEVECNGTESHLKDCNYPGWKISEYRKGTVKWIECSNKIDISLDGFKCAGAVKYSINGTPPGYFCADNLGKDEADFLCDYLGCGKSKTKMIPVHDWMIWKGSENAEKMRMSCVDVNFTKHPWQCVSKEKGNCQNLVSVECTGHKRLQLKGKRANACSGKLEVEENSKWSPFPKASQEKESEEIQPGNWCKQMYCGANVSHSMDGNGTQLTCSDKITVELKNGNEPSKCYGVVHINVNNSSQPVCGSSWNENAAKVVCKELKCGKVVSHRAQQGQTQGIMDNVNCLGNEASLWHCRAKRDNNSLTCQSKAHVVCADSVDVRLKDGPGKCAGRVEIKHEGKWKQVKNDKWQETNTNAICRELRCGETGVASSEEFSRGSNDFLSDDVSCNSDSSHIFECLKKASGNIPGRPEKAIGVTCKNNEILFLKNDDGAACSGEVGIQQGENIYWLSGSEETWDQMSADIVCQQMHCGIAVTFSNSSNANGSTDNSYSYKCTNNTKSLFDCEGGKSNSRSNTTAKVTCSGNITMTLSNHCYGTVSVCMDGKCGHMCADSLSDEDSKKLCDSLGCGNTTLPPISSSQKATVTIKSLHKTNLTKNLTQCSFVMADEDDKQHKPAYVVCSGSIKPRFSTSRDKCMGNVEVFYDNSWLPVCAEALQGDAQNTICKELECGEAVKKIAYFGPKPDEGHVISQLKCSTNTESIAACEVTTGKSDCNTTGLQCDKWQKLGVTKTCRGAVSVYMKDKHTAVSYGPDWTDKDGQMLCKELNCGRFESNDTYTSQMMLPHGESFKCSGKKDPKSIWDCEEPSNPSEMKRLNIECGAEPIVSLSNKCHGTVTINNMKVCDSQWDISYSHLLCQQQNCSNALTITGKTGNPLPKPNEDYQYVSCHDYHYTLGQCNRVKGKCNGKAVSVYCVGNVKFKTSRYCGGKITVDYGEGPKKLCPLTNQFSSFKTKLCQELGCNGHNASQQGSRETQREKMEIALKCTAEHKDVKHCLVPETCNDVPAEIYCNGYVQEQVIISPDPIPVAPIVLGVGLLLVLVILVIIFVRICVKRGKRAVGNSSRMLSMKEEEFESGDYEDVMNKSNEMENFSHDRFRSEAEVIMETDARSTSSLPYDDINEAEAQPLTSQANSDGSSRDNYIHETVLDQNGVTYEVEDPQENYDDIEASPDLAQTKAEVHNSPQTTSESDTVVPPGQVQGDVDYLVPGEDG